MTSLRPQLNELLPYLGHHGQPLSDEWIALAERCIDQVCQAATPRHCTGEFALRTTEEGIEVVGTTLVLTGQDIAHLLQHSQRCILMAATLGPAVDALIRARQTQSMAEAVVLDAAATALIERVCDDLESSISQSLPDGQKLTWRYSCGYGDLPLSLQPAFVRVLDTPRRIGLSCTSSLLLTPQKSVTAVMGIAKLPPLPRQARCETCSFSSSCSLRKAGKHCGRS